MNTFKNKLIAFSLVMACSINTFAALPTGNPPFQICASNLNSGFEFFLECLYVQPTNDDLSYALLEPPGSSSFGVATPAPIKPTSVNSTFVSIKSLDPRFQWGFRIGFGYIYPQSSNDFRLNWTHLFSSTKTHTEELDHNSPATFSILADSYNFGGDGFINSEASTNFRYDAVDLDVGQFINIGTRLLTRFSAGLRYGHFEKEFFSNINTPTPEALAFATYTHGSKFNGIGPRFGMDSSYYLGSGFGIITHLGTSLLVGRTEATATISSDEIVPLLIENSEIDSDHQTRVIPNIDARLGVDYTCAFFKNMFMNIQLGYYLEHYLDLFNRNNFGIYNAFNGSISDMDSRSSSVTFAGPFLSINLKI